MRGTQLNVGMSNRKIGRAGGLNDAEQSLRVQTQSVIREAIVDGGFHAGQKLTERTLSEITGVSRSSIREALSHLEATGLVVRQPHRGYTVAKLDPRSIFEIFELRAAVETLAAELFTERASEQEVNDIKAAIESLQHGVQAGDLGKISSAKDQFYSALFSGCRNREIQKALECVIDRVYYLRRQLMSDPDRAQASLKEMSRLAQALVERDKDAARIASIAHLESARFALYSHMTCPS